MAAALVALVRRRPRPLVGVTLVVACSFAALLVQQHWPALGQHWTQRALTDRFFAERRGDEPLAAFLMNWKGETLYTRNAVTQINAGNPRGEVQRLTERPGRVFFVVERAGTANLYSSRPAVITSARVWIRVSLPPASRSCRVTFGTAARGTLRVLHHLHAARVRPLNS